MDSRGGCVSKILYVETKESGPLGGERAPGTPPRSANDNNSLYFKFLVAADVLHHFPQYTVQTSTVHLSTG